MSNIDLKALRVRAEKSDSEGWVDMRINPAGTIALLDRLEAAERERDQLLGEKIAGPADVTVTMQDGMFLGQLTDAMEALDVAGIPIVADDGVLRSVADQVRLLATERDALREDAESWRRWIRWCKAGDAAMSKERGEA